MPQKRSTAQIRAKTAMARQVVAHHLGKPPRKITFQPTGLTNFVFEVETGGGHFIVRIGGAAGKLYDFQKEQWATARALEKGVPVPEILEVGHEVIALPYMLQKKVKGVPALDHPDRAAILFRLGQQARRIHAIPTSGFGAAFDWSPEAGAGKKTWTAYLEEELQAEERVKFLRRHRLLPKAKIDQLFALLEKVKKWTLPPALNHGDLRLKNTIVDRNGAIQAIIDWDNCSSNIAPYWDLSIALHDLSIDNKHKFLEGYGLDLKTFTRHAYALTVFNLLNYVPALQAIIGQNQEKELALYKLRLNGSLDLFSL